MIIRIPDKCGECRSCEKYKDGYICRSKTNLRVSIGLADFSNCFVDPNKLDETCYIKTLLLEAIKYPEIRFER